MAAQVQLVGFDFGTTTSSAMVATAQLTRHERSGRSEIAGVCTQFRSELVLTPFRSDSIDGDSIDEPVLAGYVDGWLAAAGVRPPDVFGGGALLTGLAAESANAAAVVRLVRARLQGALVVAADDPRLESWLAFMGNAAERSRASPDAAIVNLDIGGGTTNLALGVGGEVLGTGCLMVGARHFQFARGGYRITRLSRYAAALLAHLGIERGLGDTLADRERAAILDFYIGLIEAELRAPAAESPGDSAAPIAALYRAVPFRMPPGAREPVFMLSGGVGELVYAHLRGEPWPGTTHFGDLGIDLAQRLAAQPAWQRDFAAWTPAAAGRATVYGLLRYNTEVSGSTLFLPQPEVLPLADLPLLGTLGSETTDSHLNHLLELAASAHGGAVRVVLESTRGDKLRALAGRLSQALAAQAFPSTCPLVLLVAHNVGQVLGQYVTGWGQAPWRVIVIDEVTVPDAQYVRIGRPRDQVVPLAFYGLGEATARQ